MNTEVVTSFIYSAIRLATPLIFAALAALITNKAGMFNMAVEGMMLCSALGGVLFANLAKSVWIGLLGAVIVGVLSGLVISFATLTGKTDLYLTCIAFNLAAVGGTVFIMFLTAGEKATTSAAFRSYVVPSVTIPLINKIPILGPILSGHNLLTYFAFVSVFIVWFLLYKTRLGLRLRSVGENPKAAESVGINVNKIGYISFLLAGVFAGLGGAFMSMGWVGFFMKNMVNGRGFIGLSAMNIANSNPIGASIAAVFFGVCDALATALKSQGSFATEFLEMIPYAATILSLVIINLLRIYRMKKTEKGKMLKEA